MAISCQNSIDEEEILTRQSVFYVAPTGDDNNPGTAKSPWKTLIPVNEYEFLPGDVVYFAKGSSYRGSLLIKHSGTSQKPIKFSSYGNGPKPSFTNQNLSDLNGNIIQVRGSHIVIDDLYFHHGVSADQNQEVGAREIGAIFIISGADHNTIKNCEIEDCPVGIQVYGQYSLITQNIIHDCNRFLRYPYWGPIGIMVATSNHEISYNKITNYMVSGGEFGADGGVIEIDNENYTNYNINIHHNYSSGNDGFLEIVWGDDNLTKNIHVFYNVSDDFQQFIFFWSGTDCIVENNTVLCTRSSNIRVRVVFSFNYGNNIIRNNIFVLTNGLQVFSGTNVYGAEYYDQPHDHNIYYSLDGSQADPCAKPLGVGDIIADSLFIDIEDRDLHLQVSSPAIDAAVDVGQLLDFENNPVPSAVAPDIGAYEYIQNE